jgi:hypothetical protein
MKLLTLCLILLLTGCGVTDRVGAGLSGFSRICVDGVQYLQFTSGATVAYGPDGKVKVCKE